MQLAVWGTLMGLLVSLGSMQAPQPASQTGTLLLEGEAIYLVKNAEGMSNVYYHRADCAAFAGEQEQILVELAQMIGLRPCPACCPPALPAWEP